MAPGEQLSEKFRSLHGSKTVIVGIGNALKGDDGVGPLVCQKLQDAKVSAEVIDAGTVPENYIQPIVKKAPQNLLIIDAIDFHAPPGTIDIFKPEQLSSFALSTHTLSPHLFTEMVSRNIEADLYFVGTQPEHTRLGDSMSPQVCKAAQQLVQALIDIFPPTRSAL